MNKLNYLNKISRFPQTHKTKAKGAKKNRVKKGRKRWC